MPAYSLQGIAWLNVLAALQHRLAHRLAYMQTGDDCTGKFGTSSNFLVPMHAKLHGDWRTMASAIFSYTLFITNCASAL